MSARALTLAALTLVACSHRPKGQVAELGHVGEAKVLAKRGTWLYLAVVTEAEGDAPSMTGPIDLWKVPASGGDPKRFAEGLPPGHLSFGASTAYVGGADGSVTAVELADGATRELAQLGTWIHDIAEVGELLVVSTDQGEPVIRLRRDTGARVTTPPPATPVRPIDDLVSDGTRVVGASIDGSEVVAIDAEGRLSVVAPIQNRPTCLGLTTSHTFWARDLDGHKSELVGVAHSGQVVDRIAALESTFPACAAWADTIYYTDERHLRAVVPGQAPITLATSGWVPAMAATEDGVYWVQMISDGWEIRVNRLPK